MTIAPHRHALRLAFLKLLIRGLPPPPRMLRKQGSGRDARKHARHDDAIKTLCHRNVHRICKFNEISPLTGPPSMIDDSLASDSRSTCTLPGPGRPSTTLICDNGTFGNSLSSHTSVGAGTNSPTYRRSLCRSRFITAIS